ncbi:terminase large subunit domain-containing protein [Vitiosangium sp. GDMCC 1.1324]|uniref:phage terminase large subunit family protein n=1 Tax=Vitiosangium sp. (strain GDMCC 1.1324) TaxID=2138576 RepID=UPI000D3AC3DE|nr:terminase family protein [Vitiosangium sp. GDMCC 1.1324]PTL79098.1 large terminase [Vitiosangium sp. GDMCC 1.1324]
MQLRDDLAKLPIRTPETVGRYSLLEKVALEAQRVHGGVTELDKLLGLHFAEEKLALALWPRFSLRPVQQPPPGVWRTWFFCGGRGAGKTHAGSCATIQEAMEDPEARILLVGPTLRDIVQTMLEGPSGLLTLCPPWFQPAVLWAAHELHFPNGAKAFWIPAQDANRLRGPGYSWEWLDEMVAWPGEEKAPAVLEECRKTRRHVTRRMRQRNIPARQVVTTTPAPTPVFRKLLEEKKGLVLARSSSFDNAANLDEDSVRQWRAMVAGGDVLALREHMGALVFGDLDASIFGAVNWEGSRVKRWELIPKRTDSEGKELPLFDMLVVSVDPASGDKDTSDMVGICAVGIRREGDGLDHAYILKDASMRTANPAEWARAAVKLFQAWRDMAPPNKSFIFAESNTGGTMVKHTIRTENAKVPVMLRRAGGRRNISESKADRARPVASLAQAVPPCVHMVGKHHDLEAELSKFTGKAGGKDNRVDAMVWPLYLYLVKTWRGRGTEEHAETPDDDEAEQGEE